MQAFFFIILKQHRASFQRVSSQSGRIEEQWDNFAISERTLIIHIICLCKYHEYTSFIFNTLFPENVGRFWWPLMVKSSSEANGHDNYNAATGQLKTELVFFVCQFYYFILNIQQFSAVCKGHLWSVAPLSKMKILNF